jgi:hypothetical protein
MIFAGVRMDQEIINDVQRFALDEFKKWVLENSSTIQKQMVRKHPQKLRHPLLQWPQSHGFEQIELDSDLFKASKDLTLKADGREISFEKGDLIRRIRHGCPESYCVFWKFKK